MHDLPYNIKLQLNISLCQIKKEKEKEEYKRNNLLFLFFIKNMVVFTTFYVNTIMRLNVGLYIYILNNIFGIFIKKISLSNLS